MATSGYKEILVNQKLWGKLYLFFEWERTSYSIANNSSTIRWSMQARVHNASYGNIGSRPYTVKINDNTYAGVFDLGLESGESRVIASGATTIPHFLDGNRNFSYSFSYEFGASVGGLTTGSGVEELDAIPVLGLDAQSFNDYENLYNFDYGITTGAKGVTSLSACITFTGDKDDIGYRQIAIPTTAGNHTGTFYFTAAEKKKMRLNVTSGTSTRVGIYLKAIIDGQTVYARKWVEYSLVNALPTLAPTVVDTHPRTTWLTGDANTFVRYVSIAQFNTGAAAQKESTIDHQRIVCGSTILDDYTSNTGTINGVDSNTFYFSVTDSRGNTTNDAIVKTLIPYVKLTSSIKSIKLEANGALTFTIGGKYYKGSFGANSNTLDVSFSLQDEEGNYIFNADDSGWVMLGHINPTMNGDNYTYSYTITGLDYEKNYALTVSAVDELTPTQTSSTVISATPVFDWGRNDFNFNVPFYTKGSDVPVAGLKDYVIESGTNSNWYYRKWYSGKVELWGEMSLAQVPCNTALGGWYRTAVLTAPSFPFEVSNPQVITTYESDGYGALVWNTTLATQYRAPDFYLIRPTSSTGITGRVLFHAIGE